MKQRCAQRQEASQETPCPGLVGHTEERGLIPEGKVSCLRLQVGGGLEVGTHRMASAFAQDPSTHGAWEVMEELRGQWGAPG